MCRVRDNEHIDPDLFDVFVRKEVYLRCARQFLDPAQIDEVPAEVLARALQG